MFIINHLISMFVMSVDFPSFTQKNSRFIISASLGTAPAAIAKLVERLVCGSGGRVFELQPGPTKDFKVGNSGFPPYAQD